MNLERALDLHSQGNWQGAEQAYRRVLLKENNNVVALEKLALICLMTNRLDEGKQLIAAALRVNPNNVESYYNLAAAHKGTGSWEEVIPCCRKALELGGKLPEVYLLLGEAQQARGQSAEALATLQKAIELRPTYAEAHNQIGVVLASQGNFAEAIASIRKAIQLQPDFGYAHYNLGLVLQQARRFDEAINACTLAVKYLPIAECYFNLGNALFASSHSKADRPKKLNEALAAFDMAAQMNPNYAHAYNNRGLVLRELQRIEDAKNSFEKAIQVHPYHNSAYRNLAVLLTQQCKLDQALAAYKRGFDLQTQSFPIKSPAKKLGHHLIELRRLPLIYLNEEEVAKTRIAYTQALEEAEQSMRQVDRRFVEEELSALRSILCSIDNFFLPYQLINDRDLAVSYANLAIDILRTELEPVLSPCTRQARQGKIRVGIATESLGMHNGAIWALGWLEHLPKDDYEFFLYSIHGTIDDTTRRFAQCGTFRWIPFTEETYAYSLADIKSDELDVLIITDVGTSPRNRILSLARLAPIQCAGWAHPVTSGSPNIDYFLSNELMEPDDADQHYSEKLVKLKNLGLYLDLPDDLDARGTRDQFGLPTDKIIYGSVQSPSKYLPRYDHIFSAIAKRVPDAYFVFVSFLPADVTDVFRNRLRTSFEKEGVSFDDHVKVLPRLTRRQYMQLLTVLDLNLDSIGWSGGFTTLRSLALDLPVVTMAGQFMRGRHSLAMLKMIGVNELITESTQQYVELASELGLDQEKRAAIVAKIRANKEKLFHDQEAVDDLDSFLKRTVGEVRKKDEQLA